MARTLLIEAGACTRTQFNTFQPTTKIFKKWSQKTPIWVPKLMKNRSKIVCQEVIEKMMPKVMPKGVPGTPHWSSKTKKYPNWVGQNGLQIVPEAFVAAKMVKRWAQGLKIVQKLRKSDQKSNQQRQTIHSIQTQVLPECLSYLAETCGPKFEFKRKIRAAYLACTVLPST